MAHATVSLPTTRVGGRTSNVKVVVDGSLMLFLSEGSSSLKTSDDLLELITTRHIWLCRTGACHVSFTISLDGQPVSLTDETPLAEWIGGWEFWQRLGLRLQNCGVERTGEVDEMIFSLQHPDLSSGLVAPRGAASAEFRAWSCRIDVCFQDPSRPTRGRKQKRCSSSSTNIRQQKRPKAAEEASAHVALATSAPNDDYFYHCLTSTDRQAVEEFVSSMGFGPAFDPEKPDAAQQGKDATGLMERIATSGNARDAMEAAIKAVVCGNKQSRGGIAVLKSTSSHCLIRLAPAVFHIPYLKAVAERASLLPTIASSLARMRNAESPGLRQAVESLAGSTAGRIAAAAAEPQASNDMELVVTGLESRAWEVILSSIRRPRLPRKPAEETMSQADSPGGNSHSTALDARSSLEDAPDALPTVVSHFGPGGYALSTQAQPWPTAGEHLDFSSLGSQSSISSESCSSPALYAYSDHYLAFVPSQSPTSCSVFTADMKHIQHETSDGILSSQSSISSENCGSPAPHAYPDHFLSHGAFTPSQLRAGTSVVLTDGIYNDEMADDMLTTDAVPFCTFEDWLFEI